MKAEQSLSRSEQRKILFREKITAAALKLFEENGVNDTSVASIIIEADIAHKTFFNYFPSKDHLLSYIVNLYSESAYCFFRESFNRFDQPQQKIEYCLLNIAKTLAALNPHYKELLNFYLISGAGEGPLRSSQKQKFSELVNDILIDAKKKGYLHKEFSLQTLNEMVIGICVSVILNWSVEEDYPLVKKMSKAVVFINRSVFINTEKI